MKASGIPTRKLATGYAIGAAVTFVVVLVIALIAGAETWLAALAALFVALIAGGSVGFMLAAKKVSE